MLLIVIRCSSSMFEHDTSACFPGAYTNLLKHSVDAQKSCIIPAFHFVCQSLCVQVKARSRRGIDLENILVAKRKGRVSVSHLNHHDTGLTLLLVACRSKVHSDFWKCTSIWVLQHHCCCCADLRATSKILICTARILELHASVRAGTFYLERC